MFFAILVLSLLAGAIHASRQNPRTRERTAELMLVYTLVGYCGVPMLAVSFGILIVPERVAEMLPVGPPTPVVAFFGWAYLGMSIISTMTIWYRGAFMAAAAICWAVYFGGATIVHMHGGGGHGAGHLGVLTTFATHGFLSVILLAGLFYSGALSRTAGAPGP